MGYKLGVYGISGKMGMQVAEAAAQESAFTSIIGYNRSAPLTLADFINTSDVIIDFSSSEGLESLLIAMGSQTRPLVTGTTGLTENTQALLEQLSKHVPILYSENFSIGVSACLMAIKLLSQYLPDSFTITMQETHHIHKKDSPSGTALALARAANKTVPITSIREAEVIGRHQMFFSSPLEQIELTHEAFSRKIFADGALFAAKALLLKPKGLYSLADILSSGKPL